MVRTYLSGAGFILMALSASPALAATSTTAAGLDPSLEALTQELKAELKAELKEEIRAELGGGGAPAAESWENLDWKWDDTQKPTLNFLDLKGYFRFRYDLFKDLDLSTYYKNSAFEGGPFSPGYAPPVPICNTDPKCLAERGPGSTLGGANMRLRLEPTFNITEDISVHVQLDVLDNVVLGSTPEAFPRADFVPLLALTDTQVPPSDGVNALMDSIRIKRAWGRFRTPIGELRAGRMGSHFGLGVLANDGRGIDADYGDTNDRVLFGTEIASHKLVAAYDWAVSGPTSAMRGDPMGQPFDRDQRDDVDQFILAVLRMDTDDELKTKLENDQTVVNYGGYFVYRRQSYDAARYYADGDPNAQAGTKDLVQRDAQAFAGSLWFKLVHKKLQLELEAVGVVGTVENSVYSGDVDSTDKPFDLLQFGGAATGEYKLLDDALTIRLMICFATGDDAPGWGVRPLTNASPEPGVWDGAQQGDGKINNFRFDQDFRVDLIFWKQLVGTITDAIVIRPGAQYDFTNEIGARVDVIYSRAMYAESTPSAAATRSGLTLTGGNSLSMDANLGLEGDVRVYYHTTDGFAAWLEYGIFIPFGGLDTVRFNADDTTDVLDASIAQTVQAMIAIQF